jgi:hypothetical protein
MDMFPVMWRSVRCDRGEREIEGGKEEGGERGRERGRERGERERESESESV